MMLSVLGDLKRASGSRLTDQLLVYCRGFEGKRSHLLRNYPIEPGMLVSTGTDTLVFRLYFRQWSRVYIAASSQYALRPIAIKFVTTMA